MCPLSSRSSMFLLAWPSLWFLSERNPTSHYWFRAPFAVGGATGDASTKERDPTTAFGFHYRLQIIPKVYGVPWVAGVYFCQLSRSSAVSRGLLACLGRCLFGCYKYR